MKYLLLALAIFLLLAQLVSGNWIVSKCAHKWGVCRSKCRTGELHVNPASDRCSKQKRCCVLSGKDMNPLLCGDHVVTTAEVSIESVSATGSMAGTMAGSMATVPATVPGSPGTSGSPVPAQTGSTTTP